MVGATGIEPVTPTMSTKCPHKKARKNGHLRKRHGPFSARCSSDVPHFRFSEPKGTTLQAKISLCSRCYCWRSNPVLQAQTLASAAGRFGSRPTFLSARPDRRGAAERVTLAGNPRTRWRGLSRLRAAGDPHRVESSFAFTRERSQVQSLQRPPFLRF
jgi:hypothetical protein